MHMHMHGEGTISIVDFVHFRNTLGSLSCIALYIIFLSNRYYLYHIFSHEAPRWMLLGTNCQDWMISNILNRLETGGCQRYVMSLENLYYRYK